MIKTKEEITNWAKEWKIALFLFANAIVFFGLFYSDISRRAELGAREIIGDIHFKYNKIQRKFEKELVWDDLDANAPLSNRDSVRTDRKSQAILKLKDGTEIQMDEESMVILEITAKNQKINFEKGSINIKKNPVEGAYGSIWVESPHGSVRVTDGDVVVAKQLTESMNVGVERGEATVEIDGKTLSLKSNQVLTTHAGGISAKDQVVRLDDPIQRARRMETLRVRKAQEKLNLIQDLGTDISSESGISKIQAETSASTAKTPETVTGSTVRAVTDTSSKSQSPAKTSTEAPNTQATTISTQQATTGKSTAVRGETKPSTDPNSSVPTKVLPGKKQEPVGPMDANEEMRRKREQAELERFLKM